MAMEITKGKPSRIWCTIGHVKQYHEYYKHESLYLTPSLLLNFIYNPRQETKVGFVGV